MPVRISRPTRPETAAGLSLDSLARSALEIGPIDLTRFTSKLVLRSRMSSRLAFGINSFDDQTNSPSCQELVCGKALCSGKRARVGSEDNRLNEEKGGKPARRLNTP